ncbi:MAG: choice-of-anchor D domain-containing protein [Solirubrobacterales bacterium]|nr:choice-of-anchor D domain-containing protein [Solirubrobacterales bacterium]
MSQVRTVIVALAVLGSLWLAAPASALNFLQAPGSPYSTGELTVNSIRTGDLNGDGRDDVVTVNADYSATVFLANANGSMSAGTSLPTFEYVLSGDLGDVNMDGHLDIVLAYNDKIAVMFGNGDGTFQAPTASVTASDGTDVAVADFNGDAKPDVLVAGYTQNNVSLLLGNGDGTFGAWTSFPVGSGPISLATADFNGDGAEDFATANLNGQGAVTVMTNNGSGNFSQPVGSPHTGYAQPRGIASGDFDGDGDADLAVIARSDQRMLVLLGLGNGAFNQGPAPEINSNWGNAAASTDFDGDGRDDVLVGMSSNLSDPLVNSAPIFMGAASGILAPSPSGPWATTSPSYPWEVATGDFNDDGHADWVSGDQGGRVSVFMNEAPALTASPASLTFAGEPVGDTSAPSSVTLTSSGIGSVAIPAGGVTISGLNAGDYAIDSEDCEEQVLSAGDTCQVDVTFSPGAIGARSATLEVAHDGAGSPTSVSLAGQGQANPGISIDPASHDFGNARITVDNDSAPKTFTVGSIGTTPLEVGVVSLTGADSDQFEIDSQDCTGGPIQPGGTCQVVVDFAPTTLGPKTAELSLANDASVLPTTAALSGTGDPFSYPGFEPSELDFGPTRVGGGPSAPLTFEMEALGASPMNVEELQVDPLNGNPEDFSIVSENCLGQAIPLGDSCEVSVAFEPSATGDRSAFIRYDTGHVLGLYHVKGEGIDPGFTLAPSTQDFGTRLTDEGPGAAHTFTLTSTGTTDLQTGPISLTGAAADQFQVGSDGCSNQTLAPGSSCDVEVAFAPTTAGEKTASLSIALDGGFGPAISHLTGSGQDPIPPPDPCEPVTVKRVAYFTPSVKKKSMFPGVRARIETEKPAVVRLSSKVIYRVKGRQKSFRSGQRKLTIRQSFVNYKVAVPRNLRKTLKPKTPVRFVIDYASRSSDPQCTKFGEIRTRSLSTRVVWIRPN